MEDYADENKWGLHHPDPGNLQFSFTALSDEFWLAIY